MLGLKSFYVHLDFLLRLNPRIDMKLSLSSGHPLLIGSLPDTKRTSVFRKGIVRFMVSQLMQSELLSYLPDITITLSFPRVTKRAATDLIKETTISDSTSPSPAQFRLLPSEVIDTQGPLLLHSGSLSMPSPIIFDTYHSYLKPHPVMRI